MRLTDTELETAYQALRASVRCEDTAPATVKRKRNMLASKLLDELERRKELAEPLHMRLRQHAGPGSRNAEAQP